VNVAPCSTVEIVTCSERNIYGALRVASPAIDNMCFTGPCRRLDGRLLILSVHSFKAMHRTHAMAVKSIEELFVHELSDIYSAEKQLTRALPKLARAASEPQLAQAFESHLEETNGQVERIDKIVDVLDIRLKRMKCAAMEGLVEEGKEVIESVEKGPLRDAALIAGAQKVEHYEIASYGTLAALAKELGYNDALPLIMDTLKEEKGADEKLTKLAEQGGNQRAAQQREAKRA
jgi:ferritin-like metal-binding protein YciE